MRPGFEYQVHLLKFVTLNRSWQLRKLSEIGVRLAHLVITAQWQRGVGSHDNCVSASNRPHAMT